MGFSCTLFHDLMVQDVKLLSKTILTIEAIKGVNRWIYIKYAIS